MTIKNAEIPSIELFRVHTSPMELEKVARFAGFSVCQNLMTQRGTSCMGVAIPHSGELRALLEGILVDEAIDIIERDGRFESQGTAIVLLSEDRPATQLSGPVLALALDPLAVKSAVNATRVTDVVYVPRTEDDLNAYLLMHPESAAVKVRPQVVTEAELTEAHVKRSQWYEEHYEVIAQAAFGPSSKPIYLGDRLVGLCRYCGKSSPEVMFTLKAHAFPEQIGNKALIDLIECDACNSHFSKWIEDNFGKWTLPMRSLGRVNGKGIPKLRSSDKSFRVEAENAKELKIFLRQEDPRHQLNTEAKTVTLKLERQPYVPMGVFKCLVKMALAVMPATEAAACAHLKSWILQKGHTFESYPYRPLNIFVYFLPGPLPNDSFQFILLRRHTKCADCPFMTFILQFSNVVYQIILPMHNEDRPLIEAGKYDFSFFPHLGGTKEYEAVYGASQSKIVDMSGTEIVRGEHETMCFHFDELVDVPVPPPTA